MAHLRKEKSRDYDDYEEANTMFCCKKDGYKHNYQEIQDEMCELLKLKETEECIGDDDPDNDNSDPDSPDYIPSVIKCLKHRCDNRNYIIICIDNCEPGKSGRTTTAYLNINMESTGYMYLCTNNKVHTVDEIKEFIFHELFHMCDRGGRKNRTYCAEWRAYRSTYCIFKNPSSKKHKMSYKRKCYECLFKGKDCNPKPKNKG